MAKLSLTLACGDYELLRPLADGRVRPDGIDLLVLSGDRTRTLRPERRDECDLAEFNVVGYLMDRDAGQDLVALPVFPHRRFRHGFAFVSVASGATAPSDLVGRRVGIRGRAPAGVVWLRGILADCYGLAYESVRWVDSFGVLGDPPEGAGPGQPTIAANNVLMDELLLDGRLEALLSPSFPPAFLRGDRRIQRLFPNFKDEEMAYYRRSSIFPIMHVVVAHRQLIEAHPWVPASMAAAFQQAKQLAYQRIRNPRSVPLAFLESAWEEQEALLGPDPWRYGLCEQNWLNLETIIRYAHEQGLISRRWPVDEAFVPLGDDCFTGTPGF